MIRLVAIFAIVAVATGASPKIRPIVPVLDGRIVGGEDAVIEEFPHQLSLQHLGEHICGASILTATRALTAAHCTDGMKAADLSVRAGSTFREKGGTVVKVQYIFQNFDYNPRVIDYDVSVLLLEKELQFSDKIKPIALHEKGAELDEGAEGKTSGWGKLCQDKDCSIPDNLQKVALPKVSDEVCKKSYATRKITPRMVCHGYQAGGKDACQGDSGGPLIFGDKQVGIVSWGLGCARPTRPGVYTRIANPEINDYISKHL